MSGNQAGQPAKTPKLLDQVRAVLRVQRYALRTERAYCDWVRRYVKFHGMKSREDLAGGTRKVEAFLTHLAVEGRVAASTQNQALNALLFLYEKVLEQPMEDRIDAVRARRPARVPEVLTPEEARRVIALVSGPAQLVVKLLYGIEPGRAGSQESAGWFNRVQGSTLNRSRGAAVDLLQAHAEADQLAGLLGHRGAKDLHPRGGGDAAGNRGERG